MISVSLVVNAIRNAEYVKLFQVAFNAPKDFPYYLSTMQQELNA